MPLPKVPYQLGAKQNVTIALRGINWSDNYGEGSLADSLNLTAVRYPYFSTKSAREELPRFRGSSAISAWNHLVYVMDNRLHYSKDGENYTDCGYVEDGEKEFVMMYKKLIVWPDKKFLSTDAPEDGLQDMGSSITGPGAEIDQYTDTDHMNYSRITQTGTWSTGFDEVFKKGDTIELSGFTNTENNGYHQIEKVTSTELWFAENTLITETSAGEVSFARNIPDMDYICESGNRLWGCSNSSNTIFCSRLDDPTNFHDYSGEADDSFTFDVTTPGEFTGCVKLSSSVLFFKEQCLHKILGSFAAEFQMYTYTMHGIAQGSHKSAKVINEVLYYLSTDGVYIYNGGSATLISSELGTKRLVSGVAETDGVNYYLSAIESESPVFLIYFSRYGLWLKEDTARAVDMARVGNEVYILTSGGFVYKENGTDATVPVDFLIQFKPLYETVTGSYNRSSVAFGHKRYGKVILRTEMSSGSWAAFDIREDGGVWREVQKIVGKTGLSRVVLPIGRADRYEIRIRGNGQFTLKNMLREFRIGSDK